MKNSTVAIALSIAFLTAPVVAQQHAATVATDAKPLAAANVASPDEVEVLRVARAWTDAMLRRDRPALESLMSPGYVLHSWDGAAPDVPRAQWLDALMGPLAITHFEQKAMTARVYGDVGVVTSKYDWSGTFRGKPFASKGFLTDVLARSDGRWHVASRTSGPLPGGIALNGSIVEW